MNHSSRRVAAIVSRTASSGDAVARVTPPTDSAETSNASGSPAMPSSSALAIGTEPVYTTCCRPSSSVAHGAGGSVRTSTLGASTHDPLGPGRGQLERRPGLRGDGDGVGGHAPGEQLGARCAQRRPVGAAQVVDEGPLERPQQAERGDGERHGEQPGGEQRDPQAHRAAAAPEPADDVHDGADCSVVDEAVADRAHGLQAVAGEGPVDLRAQVADVHLDDVVVAVEVEAPHLGQQLGLGRRATVAAGEGDEQLQLAGREDELAGATPAAPLVRVDAQVADRQHAVDGVRGPADQGPQAGDEHDEAERLAQEVVGAELETLGLVVLALLGREHQHRRAVAAGAQLPAHGVAVQARQQDVEHDRRVGALAGPPQAVRSAVGDVDLEALGAQAAGDGVGEAHLVLDDQQPHAHECAGKSPRREGALSSLSGGLIVRSAPGGSVGR